MKNKIVSWNIQAFHEDGTKQEFADLPHNIAEMIDLWLGDYGPNELNEDEIENA